MNDNNSKKYKFGIVLGAFFLLEIILGIFIFGAFSPVVSGGVGQNVVVPTFLQVGASFPEIENITIDSFATDVTLTPNSTTIVTCEALIVDWNNESDIYALTGVFYDTGNSTYASADDNNTHYTNSSCTWNTSFIDWHGSIDDIYHVLGECTFQVQYYAHPTNWNCSMVVNDTANLTDQRDDDIAILELLAVGLPESINYGLVNSTYVSDEQIANVENMGNVQLNLSLYGYAFTPGDGQAMNCSVGRDENISIDFEKYNLTSTTVGAQTLTQFETNYVNLTSGAVVKDFDLRPRFNDDVNEAYNNTYWRIYVPQGVAGNCTGNIVFGATKADGS